MCMGNVIGKDIFANHIFLFWEEKRTKGPEDPSQPLCPVESDKI